MQLIWPVLRTLFKKRLYRRCSRCILNERCVSIDPRSGVCELCSQEVTQTHASHDGEATRQAMAARIRMVIDANPTTQFHGLLLFSGGKDSCYMLMRLQQEFPGIRILCLSVDNTFMSPVAIDNINSIVKKLGLAHMWVRPPAEMMNQIFRKALSDTQAKMGIVDFIDGELMSDIGRTTAKRFGIPLVFMGLSPEQVVTILGVDSFEMPVDERVTEPRTQVGGIKLAELCDESWGQWWWPGARPGESAPALLFPLYAWHVSEQEIINAIAQAGVVRMKKLAPAVTNHQLIIPMAIVDYVRHGYFTYEPEFAEMIRKGRSRRCDWISIFEFVEFAAKTGKLLGPSFDRVLGRLGLNREDLGIPGRVATAGANVRAPYMTGVANRR